MTRYDAHHYLGFAVTQWRQFEKTQPRRVKHLLYVYRVLLTGLHLMRTGQVEANLLRLNQAWRLPYLPDLVARKVEGSERAILDEADLAFHEREYHRLVAELEQAWHASGLPEAPSARPALHELLLRVRQAAAAVHDPRPARRVAG